MPPERHFVVYTDGGARGNPGPAAIGVVIEQEGRTVHTISQTIGTATNNQAEYQALHAALVYLVAQQPTSVDIFCDSELVVNQIRGHYKMKNKELGPWFLKIHQLLYQVPRYTITAIPRERNIRADALVNQALDALST